jgi:hypothetical protein
MQFTPISYLLFTLPAVVAMAGCARDDRPIGTATMLEDGTIILDLVAEGSGGERGHGRFTYPTTHKQYAEILKHLGGLKPGESKLVPPFPDNSEKEKRRPRIEEKFLLTDKPQDAVFVTTYGWTGGMGQPVLEPATGQVRRYQGLPIFISGELEEALRNKLPMTWSGRLHLIVSADVLLVKKTERNESIPGGPRETYWEVKVNKLRDVQIQVVPR